MRSLIFLVFLLAGCCAHGAVVADESPACHAAPGVYMVYYRGEIPSDPRLQEDLCPTEVFLDVRAEKVVRIDVFSPNLYCGTHNSVARLANGTRVEITITTTKDGLGGHQISRS